MQHHATYTQTRGQVEDYFDRTATRVWAQLTSDAPVSRVRRTVRAGRDEMRALMLSRLPVDLRGKRVLDAGCGTGAMAQALAQRGADVVGIDISPALLEIAEQRLPQELRSRVMFRADDMLADHGTFDAVIAMDSLIYYGFADLVPALAILSNRTPKLIFSVAPRTMLLQIMWGAGRLFPRADRSPRMVPQDIARLIASVENAANIATVSRGFYTSACLEISR